MKFRLNRYFFLSLLACAIAPSSASASPQPQTVDQAFFAGQVKPLLEKRCLGCHGVGSKLGGLDLRSQATAMKGGIRGAAFTPGHPDDSVAFAMIVGKRQPQMPPNFKLPPAEVEILRKWIASGASYGDVKLEEAAKQLWWSFVPPKLVKAPNLNWPVIEPPRHQDTKNGVLNRKDTKTQRTAFNASANPIDAFVLAKLRENGLSPSPPANRRVLIRRAYFDLIGLPPTPEETAAFEADKSPNAWEKVVDRLLASPHYGERWGRHWLDVVRYADSGGFEGDRDRPLMYRYRDYVIQSFNGDKPFNRFVQEQIAGDELWPNDPEALIATGYLAGGCEDLVEKNAKSRADEIDDLIMTTGQGMLGLTLGCARCHDHKYDPVLQKDYYRLYACFAPSKRVEMPIGNPEERRLIDAENAPVEKQLATLRAEWQPLRDKGIAAAKKDGQLNPTDEHINRALDNADRNRLAELTRQITQMESKRKPYPQAYAVTDTGPTFATSHVLVRGDAYVKGDAVEPGFIRALPGGDFTITEALATKTTTGRRKALAEWITNKDNPLPARVWMNRVWRQHFGRGLVNSPSNFGLNGDTPSHPELLDWLAIEFAKNGGHTKPIHRMILLSNAWQQSSLQRLECMKTDPQNRYLWRMPVRRLEAEAIRDTMLAASGTLNTEIGGPAVYPPVDPSLRADTFQGINWPEGEDSYRTWRRSVYVKVKRSLIFPQLDVFDCPEISATVGARNVTTTPNQALLMLNDPLIRRQATLFAERLKRECGDDSRAQIDRAYRLTLSRAPNAKELSLCLDYLKSHPVAEFCHSMLNLSEMVYVE